MAIERIPESGYDFRMNNIKAAIPQILQNSLEFARGSFESKELVYTEAGAYCLWYALAQSAILRPLLSSPEALKKSGLTKGDWGSDYNPSLNIDIIGGLIASHIFSSRPGPTSLFVEENKRWDKYGSRDLGERWIVMVDPLDETSGIKNDMKTQTTGMLVTDTNGEFLAGAVSSLVDNTILLVEKDGAVLINFDMKRQKVTTEKITRSNKKSLADFRVATLGRRFTKSEQPLNKTQFSKNKQEPDLDSFGGYGLLSMIKNGHYGYIDAMIDPLMGQPWYEAVIWGYIAREMGLSVIGKDGMEIDFGSIILKAWEESDEIKDWKKRVPIIISQTPELSREICKQCNSKL